MGLFVLDSARLTFSLLFFIKNLFHRTINCSPTATLPPVSFSIPQNLRFEEAAYMEYSSLCLSLCFNHSKKSSTVKTEGYRYNLIQQLSVLVAVCTLASCSFLPYFLQLDLYDADPDTPYSGAVDDLLIDIINAVVVACMSMMLLEALIDSNNLYLPIKIAFPRFLMVFGILFISLVLYGQQTDGMNRLSFLVCSHYAKIYFICGGIFVRLLQDATEQGSYRWLVYVHGIGLYTAEVSLRQWGAYIDKSHSFVILQNFVTVGTLSMGIYFMIRAAQLLMSLNDTHDSHATGHHYHDSVSHMIIFIFVFCAHVINMAFGYQTWKNTTAAEFTAYNIFGLFACVLFFFTSSYIAQRHFVMAKVFLYYIMFSDVQVYYS